MLTKLMRLLGNYFYRIGILFHWVVAIGIVIGIVFSVHTFLRFDLPVSVFLERSASSMQSHKSPLVNMLAKPTAVVANWFSADAQKTRYTFELENGIVGAQPSLSHTKASERLTINQRANFVATVPEFLTAIENAKAGDDIVLLPGEYQIKRARIYLLAQGEYRKPIRIRADKLGSVKIALESFEGFVVKGGFWHVENLTINGICAKHSACEHAFHLVGANNIVLRNNRVSNFNSIIKANGDGNALNRRYPDDVIIENNTLFNDTARKTVSAVTHIDVVAGNNWQIRRNILLNNSKQGSDFTSYAAFLKGDSHGGIIEQNVVDCEHTLPNDNSTRIGLSFGGGGTGESYCRGGICEQEHANGTMRNNLILNCSQDVGIYINKGRDSRVINNTILNSLGVDVRFKESTAFVAYNLLDGGIRSRDNSTIKQQKNVMSASFSKTQGHQSTIETDLCGFKRGKFSPVGALTKRCQDQLQLRIEITK